MGYPLYTQSLTLIESQGRRSIKASSQGGKPMTSEGDLRKCDKCDVEYFDDSVQTGNLRRGGLKPVSVETMSAKCKCLDERIGDECPNWRAPLDGEERSQ